MSTMISGVFPVMRKMLSATQQVFYGRFKNTGRPFRMKKAKPSERGKRSRTKKPDLLLFVNDLENDFHNYCACIKHGLGNKADLCALTEALLCYGCEDTVWEEVTEWHTAVSENKNFAKSTFLPNFDRLYIRQADRFLFLELNTEEALKFYGLATMLWDHEPDAKETNSDDHFVSFTRQYELYSRNFERCKLSLWHILSTIRIFQLYNRIIHSGISSSSLSEKLSTFVLSIQEIMESPSSRSLHRARLALLMFIVITKKHFIPELARLYDDPDRSAGKSLSWKNPACLRIPVTLFFLTMQRI